MLRIKKARRLKKLSGLTVRMTSHDRLHHFTSIIFIDFST
jgi:hypothetical protein